LNACYLFFINFLKCNFTIVWWVGGTASCIGQGLFEAGVQLPLVVVESWSFCINHNVLSLL
jgi:hypothetical protein